MRTIACVFVAALSLLAACGDDDDSSSGSDSNSEPFVEALGEALQNDGAKPSLTGTESKCLAQAIVDSVGVKALDDAGVTPEKLAEADDLASLNVDVPADAQDGLADAVGDCKATGVLKNQVVAGWTESLEVSLTAPSVDCLTTEIDDETINTVWAATAVDGSSDTSEIQAQVTSAAAACPGTMAEVALGTSALADAYGGEVPEGAVECIGTYIEANADTVASALTSGDPAADMATIATACPAPPAEAPAA